MDTNLGAMFDRLVESARKTTAQQPSAPKPSAQSRLTLSQSPIRKLMPLVERSISEIPANVRSAIRSCLTGETAWPLVLFGPPGTGKTCAALCLLDYVEGFYFTVGELCEKLNQAGMGRLEWSKEGHGGVIWPEKFRHLYIHQPSLFVLDELGLRDSVSDAHYDAVYRCVEMRARRPFIAISNHDMDRLTKIYDARTVSRLAAGTLVEVSGKDRRLE